MPLLDDLTRRISEAIGFGRTGLLNLLREHLKAMDDKRFEEELRYIVTLKQLRILWEAGLTATQQQLVAKRAEEIVKWTGGK